MQVWCLAFPITIFFFMICVVAALRPSVTMLDIIVWTQCKTCSEWKPIRLASSGRIRGPGEKGCHRPVLRGHAGDTSACSWCAVKPVLVWFTRKCMESGGCSRETVAPSELNGQSDGYWCEYALKCHSSTLAKQTLSMYQEQNLLHVQANLHLWYKFPKLHRMLQSSFSI